MKKLFTLIIYLFAAIGFVLSFGYFAVKYGLTNEQGIIDTQRNTFTQGIISGSSTIQTEKKKVPWAKTEEWNVLRQAILRDQVPITQAAELLNVSPRLIASIIMVEQMRLYYDDRELFKKVFAPLKILGVQSQFSWGVVGIKKETAVQVENNLTSSSSPYYLGKSYEHVLDFKTEDHDKERFERLTDQHNRYYSYLYTATLIKELERQWENAGYPLHSNPAVIATLFNIGFEHSRPHANPQSGGASITIENIPYSFGSLAGEFYSSNELLETFPR